MFVAFAAAFLLAASSTPQAGATDSAETSAPAVKADAKATAGAEARADGKICRRIEGGSTSRNSKKICKTAAQWKSMAL